MFRRELVTRDYLRGEIRDLLEEFKELQSTDKKDDPKTSWLLTKKPFKPH